MNGNLGHGDSDNSQSGNSTDSPPKLTVDYPAGAVEIRISPLDGRGVFATQGIEANRCFDSSPVLFIPEAQRSALKATDLYHHSFEWKLGGALVMGPGSFYNHSNDPSALYIPDHEGLRMDFVTRRSIDSGEEITISYGEDLWFDPTV
jgi:hypothetical protein